MSVDDIDHNSDDTHCHPHVDSHCRHVHSADGSLGAERAWSPRAGRARALPGTGVRPDDGRRDRQPGRAHRAHLLPALRRQARGAVRRGCSGRGTRRGRGRGAGRHGAARRRDRSARVDVRLLRRTSRARAATPGGHRGQPEPAGARAHQARLTRHRHGRCTSSSRRHRTRRQPGGRDGRRGLQGRLRTLDQRRTRTRPCSTHPGIARRTANRHCGSEHLAAVDQSAPDDHSRSANAASASASSSFAATRSSAARRADVSAASSSASAESTSCSAALSVSSSFS